MEAHEFLETPGKNPYGSGKRRRKKRKTNAFLERVSKKVNGHGSAREGKTKGSESGSGQRALRGRNGAKERRERLCMGSGCGTVIRTRTELPSGKGTSAGRREEKEAQDDGDQTGGPWQNRKTPAETGVFRGGFFASLIVGTHSREPGELTRRSPRQ